MRRECHKEDVDPARLRTPDGYKDGVEIRPSFAQSFDLQMHIDGFDASIEHLPAALSGVRHLTRWLTLIRIDLLVTAIMTAGISYVLLFLYAFTVLPQALPAVLLIGLLGLYAVDIAVESVEPVSRRLNELLLRRLHRRGRLRLDASRLRLAGHNWRLAEVDRLSAQGTILCVELREAPPVIFVTRHSPWECAQLCALVNREIARHRYAPPPAPEDLQRLLRAATQPSEQKVAGLGNH